MKNVIEKVESNHRNTNLSGDGIVKIVTALNPLGFISENIAQISHTMVEIKRINAEIHRINAEKNVRIEQINATKEVLLTAIKERHKSLKEQLNVVDSELNRQHISKMRIIDAISNLTNLICDPSYPSADKPLLNETMLFLTNSLAELGKESSNNLQMITNTTMKSLEAIPDYKLLLLEN